MVGINEIKALSIHDYLTQRGVELKQRHGYWLFKSPVHKDTNWSCVLYPTNTFYDWSAGFGGSIIDLVMAMDNVTAGVAMHYLAKGKYEPFKPNYKESFKSIAPQFEYTKYLTQDTKEWADIKEYAWNRQLINGYESCFYHVNIDDVWWRKAAVGFIHRDEDNKICGIKFRNIDKDDPERFSSRGRMGFYILEYIDKENFGEPTLYVVEGETNANSLWQHCQEIHRNCVVISFGGVGNLPSKLPEKYDYIADRKLIIDYDGNDELYYKRIRLYRHYVLEAVKMQLDKGVDINSLFCKGKMNLIDKLL